MILKRLYELAEREGLLEDPAFERIPVPFIVNLGPQGEYFGIEERRGVIPIPGKKNAPPKNKPDKGKELNAPKAHGNTANRGFSRYFVDTLARVLPVSDEAKSVLSRQTFWEQIARAADETKDPALMAVRTFGENIANDPDMVRQLQADLESKKPAPGDRCTFVWHPDGGTTVLERPTVRDWYRRFFSLISTERENTGPQGLCQITGEFGPIPTNHPNKIAVPGWMPSGVSLVSNDKAAFESYGLDKAVNAGIGYRAAEGYTRALNELVANKLTSRKTSLRLGNVLFLFWTREKRVADYLMQLNSPEPDQVAELIQAAHKGRPSYATEPADFYCLCLSGNAARAIVRDYLEAPLPEVQANLGKWFEDLRIIQQIDSTTKEIAGLFPLWMLSNTTVRNGGDVSPHLPVALMSAALKNRPVPAYVLTACLRRIHVETGYDQFRPPRMGLIRLILNRFMRQRKQGETEMSESLDESRPDPAYVCGRIMAVLEHLQSLALGKVGASIVDRYFGAASTAPSTVFPRLMKNSEFHLGKAGEKYPGQALAVKNMLGQLFLQLSGINPGLTPAGEITDALDRMNRRQIEFPKILDLEAQGRFAIGFYHQRAAYRAASAERRAAETKA